MHLNQTSLPNKFGDVESAHSPCPNTKLLPDIGAIQRALREEKIDGWLFYDILHRDPIAYRVLNLHDVMAKRRWFYWIPAKGEPRKLVHRIESFGLDALPGAKLLYSAQDELRKNLPKLLGRAKNLAMQYSPDNAIPSISVVDAGTIEMIRSFKMKVVSSANLVQKIRSCVDSGATLFASRSGPPRR